MGPVPEQRTRREYAGTVSYSEYHPFAARPFKSDWGPANAAIVSFDPANVKVSFFQTAAPTAQHSRGVFRQIQSKKRDSRLLPAIPLGILMVLVPPGPSETSAGQNPLSP